MSVLELEGAPPPPATPTADAAIVAGLRARDRAAVADLYDRYADRLLGFCAGMLRDSHEAADALHDTILVAAERIDQLRDPERLRPWLYAIARTQCLARLRRRERTAVSEDPTELTGGRPMGGEAPGDDDTARAVEGGEAGELVWAAAEGLDDGDRVLLELHLRQGLVGAELAAAAGVKPGQISMVTGRMRERLERSLGALLVARHGSADCDELASILRGWDGRLTVLVRKRVARHVDRCEVCTDRHAGLVAPLGSLAVGLPVVLATTDLREAVLAGVDRLWGSGAAAPDVTDGEPWDDDGFPPADDRDEGAEPAVAEAAVRPAPSSTRRRAALASAAAVLLLLGGLLAWRAAADDGDEEVRAATVGADEATTTTAAGATGNGAEPDDDDAADDDPEPDEATTTTTAQPGAPASSPTAGPTTTTTTPPLGDPGPVDPAPGPTAPAPGPGLGGGGGATGTTPAPAPAPTTVPNRAPSITSMTAPASLSTACGSPSEGIVEVRAIDADGDPLTATIRWTGPGGPGDLVVEVVSPGHFRADIGPFESAGTVTVTATVRDAGGRADDEVRTFPLVVAPC